MTALHWATRRGNLEAAMLLIKRGSDINAKDIVIFAILKEYENDEILKNISIFRLEELLFILPCNAI